MAKANSTESRSNKSVMFSISNRDFFFGLNASSAGSEGGYWGVTGGRGSSEPTSACMNTFFTSTIVAKRVSTWVPTDTASDGLSITVIPVEHTTRVISRSRIWDIVLQLLQNDGEMDTGSDFLAKNDFIARRIGDGRLVADDFLSSDSGNTSPRSPSHECNRLNWIGEVVPIQAFSAVGPVYAGTSGAGSFRNSWNGYGGVSAKT